MIRRNPPPGCHQARMQLLFGLLLTVAFVGAVTIGPLIGILATCAGFTKLAAFLFVVFA
ncbi:MULTISPECIES: hypothetical protein [unclassified Bradyrhizobium]|uniref:hypothetical protein n=1 Tax=unclassified Bradyrhizobium TaxID=2631580 RepID=UPI0028F113A2|nr:MULTISPECIES: hypothetical protein [unclassified Bradyrhizobium]